MSFKVAVLIILSVSMFACTTGPIVVQQKLNDVAVVSDSDRAITPMEQKRIREISAVAKASVDVARVNAGQGNKALSATSECDVAQTGAHRLPQCVRAVTTADELEVIQIGENGVKVLVE